MSTLARGLSPVRDRLGNGAVLIAQQTTTAPVVTISASIRAGSLYEPVDQPGLASLIARLLDRGTARRPADRIAAELDDRGVALEFGVSRHTVTISATCLGEDFDDLLALVADVVRHPAFPDEQLQRRRAELITGLRQDADNPFVRAGETLLEELYGSTHPYGRPVKGTAESLERIERRALAAFHDRWFRPSALSLVIVGDVPPAEALSRAEHEFGGWRGGPVGRASVPEPPPAEGRRHRHIDMPGKAQADIAYGFTTIGRLDPAYYAYWMMNTILGEFGLGGRVAANIRERQGMAYYAFSSFDPASSDASLTVRAGVDPKDVRRAIEAIDLEVRQLGADGPTPAEMEETRQFLVGSIPRLFETNQSIAAFLQAAEHFGLGLDYDRRLPALLAAVTIEDVAAAAGQALRAEAATVVVAGPPGAGA